ncbi:hypothetical protein [Kitasatospora aureofaciens]|uniref:hypothetical protein n=1 Tax=Kitasatospora aureofaciens TaxID=1894 RepID=UPI00131B1ED6|nr:hypothetical protein [Kitasatospora aureofaciens]
MPASAVLAPPRTVHNPRPSNGPISAGPACAAGIGVQADTGAPGTTATGSNPAVIRRRTAADSGIFDLTKTQTHPLGAARRQAGVRL